MKSAEHRARSPLSWPGSDVAREVFDVDDIEDRLLYSAERGGA